MSEGSRHMSATRTRTIARSAAAVLAPLWLASCTSAEVQKQGTHQTEASYALRSLTAALPEWVTPQAVAAAAEQTFRDRGYAVTSAVSTTDSVRVVAREPNTGSLKKIVVSATWHGGGSSVSVTSMPLGDQLRSRAILDGVLARLGL